MTDPSMTEEDRLLNQISQLRATVARLEQEKRDLEQASQLAEDSFSQIWAIASEIHMAMPSGRMEKIMGLSSDGSAALKRK